jgi:hypothetical protein
MGRNGNKQKYTGVKAASTLLLTTLFLLTAAAGISCGGGSPTTALPATTSSTPPAATTSAAPTTSVSSTTSAAAQTTAAAPKTTVATTAAAPPTSAATTKPTTSTAVATTTKTGAQTGAGTGTATAAVEKPVRLVVDIEKMETSGFSTVWLRPLSSQGSILVVEGTVAAKLTLIKLDGSRVPAFSWDKISFDETNYTLMAKGAEVAFPYPNNEDHDYNEPGILQVTLTLKDGTKLTAELSNISLHPSVIS